MQLNLVTMHQTRIERYNTEKQLILVQTKAAHIFNDLEKAVGKKITLKQTSS